MLGKLFKHEFCETGKLLVPLNLVLLVLTLIGVILLGTDILQNEAFELLAVGCMMLYITSIFALFVVTGIYLAVRYYKTMYSSQGYLTHTLPVATSSIVNTKILVSSFWIGISLIITIVSIFLLLRVGIGEEWNSIDFAIVMDEFSTVFGMGFGEFMAFMIASVVLSCFAMMLMIFASLAIGQLFNQHRILASVGTYVVFYVIQQIVGLITTFILGFGNLDALTVAESASVSLELASFYRATFWASIIETIIFCAVFYFSCQYITGKKLNLE